MNAKKHIQKFFLKTWDTTSILVAFWPNNKANNNQNIKIADAIYNKFVKDGHLELTDAETVYQYITKSNLDYDKDSLAICEFDKDDNLVQNVFGDKINTSYEKAGSELRFYFSGMNNLAFTVSLKSNPIPKNFLWAILLVIVIVVVFCLVSKYINIQTVREENRQHEKELLDSIEQVSLQKADLSAKLDSITDIQNGANEELVNSKAVVTRKQQEIDSITRALHEREEELEILKQQVKSNPKKQSVSPTKKQKNQTPTKPTKVTKDKKNDNFKTLVDRGNQFARSYHYTGSESDRFEAIRCYTKALEIRSDVEIRNRLSKLQKK